MPFGIRISRSCMLFRFEFCSTYFKFLLTNYELPTRNQSGAIELRSCRFLQTNCQWNTSIMTCFTMSKTCILMENALRPNSVDTSVIRLYKIHSPDTLSYSATKCPRGLSLRQSAAVLCSSKFFVSNEANHLHMYFTVLVLMPKVINLSLRLQK